MAVLVETKTGVSASVGVVYCPKCGSTNIEIVMLDPPKPLRISIDKLPGPNADPRIIEHHHWRATCKDCGYSREYWD